MKSTIILLFLIGVLTFSEQSDDGYVEYKDAKMLYKFIPTPMTWNQARIYCQSQNAEMAMPKTPKQLEALTKAFKAYPPSPGATYPHLFMAGFHDFFNEGTFINLKDYKPIAKFLKWSPGEPNELLTNEQEDCGCFGRDGSLYDFPCHAPGVFFCEKDSDVQQDEYKYYPQTGMDYKFVSEAMLWDEARSFCESEHARLAMPMNEVQMKTLTSLFKSYPQPKSAYFPDLFLLGFHDYFNEGEFTNVRDNKPIPSFLRWQPGEPNELVINEQEDCGCIFKHGRLCDHPCDRPGVFFCERTHLLWVFDAIKFEK